MVKKELENINIVIIGHVDTGKSTTCGNLIRYLGKIDPRVLEKYEKEAKEIGKSSFKFAWVMDKLKSERDRGITIQESLNELFTEKKKITIIDAPGHRDFIKNMISGASQADVAILMLSAAKGEFEAGISQSGQTREHALLAQTLGINFMIVCVNKMDLLLKEENKNAAKERFDEIVSDMKDFFKKMNYNSKKVYFIPISGFHGDNLVEKSARFPWYKGKTLKETINDLKPPKRSLNKPLRLPVQQKYKIQGIGCVASGRVETGVLEPGMVVQFSPGKIKAEVKSVEMHHQSVPKAQPGDNVGFNVRGVSNKDVRKGMVVGKADNNPPKVCKSFKARLLIMNHNGKIKVGYTPVVFVHSAHVACKIAAIESIFDKKNGEITDKNPSHIEKGKGANVILVPQSPLVVESFSDFSAMGRFSIRDSSVTVGVGVITSVEYED